MPDHQYLYRTEAGGYRVTGTRVSLDSVVYAWRAGADAETIVRDFPALTLEQVHGALAAYLREQPRFDAYLAEVEKERERFERECDSRNVDLRERIRTRAEALRR